MHANTNTHVHARTVADWHDAEIQSGDRHVENTLADSATTPRAKADTERHLLPRVLSSGLKKNKTKYSSTNIFTIRGPKYYPALGQSNKLHSLISSLCSRPHPGTPLYYFTLQFLPHACRPAHMPRLCCCVPTNQQACRPVQERAIERKRWGSQLRLGNGRLNTSGCVRRAYVCSGKRRTSPRAAGSALALECACVCRLWRRT